MEPVFIYSSRLAPYSTSPLLSSASIACSARSAFLPSPRPNSKLPFSHHRHFSLAPIRRSSVRHNSIAGRVVIYWVMVFWRQRTYVSTSSNPTVDVAASIGGYSQAELPPSGRPSCGGIHLGSSGSFVSSPRYPCQTRGLPEQPPCKQSGGPGVCTLPPQNLVETCPYTLGLTNISNHRQKFVIRFGMEPTNVSRCSKLRVRSEERRLEF